MNIQTSNTPLETTQIPENNNTTRNIIANRDKEFYILPITIKDNEIFIFSNNYFYENWNKNNNTKSLIDFILLPENIETIQFINKSRDNLLDLDLKECSFKPKINNYKNVKSKETLLNRL